MVEVEIRGRLDEAGYQKLKQFFEQNGRHIESHNREFYLLFDYPGYHEDPMSREVDIRLRNTDGFCEIMLKRKVSEGNTARHEVSLPLQGNDLSAAIEIVKAFGCKTALKTRRAKDIYEYKGIEWSLVTTPKDYHFYEAEKAVEAGVDVEAVRQELMEAVKEFDLEVLEPDAMREYIFFLDKEASEIVDL
jgi:predicted adenylyl cyclase CyaB